MSDGVLDGAKMRSLLKPQTKEEDMNADELRVWKYLMCFIDDASEEGVYFHLLSINSSIIVIYLHVDLKGFLQFVTGSPHPIGNIAVVFDSDESEAIAAGTCGKQLTLSTKILDKGLFVSAITTLGKEISYTML